MSATVVESKRPRCPRCQGQDIYGQEHFTAVMELYDLQVDRSGLTYGESETMDPYPTGKVDLICRSCKHVWPTRRSLQGLRE